MGYGLMVNDSKIIVKIFLELFLFLELWKLGMGQSCVKLLIPMAVSC